MAFLKELCLQKANLFLGYGEVKFQPQNISPVCLLEGFDIFLAGEGNFHVTGTSV